MRTIAQLVLFLGLAIAEPIASPSDAQSLCLNTPHHSWVVQTTDEKVIFRCLLNASILDGPVEHRFASGELALSGQYTDNKRSGVWVRYSKAGTVLDRGRWKDDHPDGDWEFFDPQTGTKVRTQTFLALDRLEPLKKGWANHVRIFWRGWAQNGGALSSVGIAWQPQWRFAHASLTAAIGRSRVSGNYFGVGQWTAGWSHAWGRLFSTQLGAGVEVWQSTWAIMPTVQGSLSKTLLLGPFDQWFLGYGITWAPGSVVLHEMRAGVEVGW